MKIVVEQDKQDALVDAIMLAIKAGVQDISRDPECTPLLWDAEVLLANALREVFKP